MSKAKAAPRARDAWVVPILAQLLGRERAVAIERSARDSYWEEAVRRGEVSEQELLAAASAKFQLPVAELAPLSLEASAFDASIAEACAVVPAPLARRCCALPLAATPASIDVAIADPTDVECEQTLSFATGRAVRLHLAAAGAIRARLARAYRTASDRREGVTRWHGRAPSRSPPAESSDARGRRQPTDATHGRAASADAQPIVRLVDEIVRDGIAARASDIHLESGDADVEVKFRIDGVLRERMRLPREVGLPLVSRVKIMSGLDIADRLRPQDGRARATVDGERIDLRVSTLPAAHGEKVVIRILDSRATVLTLDGLGLDPDDADRVARLGECREGLVLVTGPTGSGKTTTLYSLLRRAQARGVNIVTVEDPVEYRLPGLVQVQVNERAGLTFAAALRSILRQDPDVVLVGEIRDRETAAIAVQAALTGHLVLSTLHTSDAPSSITRLRDLGVDDFKIAAALKGVIAQRLVRRFCDACRDAAPLVAPAAECRACGGAAYRGRLAAVEALTVSEELGRLIAGGAPVGAIASAARAAGMRSLWESAMSHAGAGRTDVAELLRVLEPPASPATTSRTGVAPASPAATLLPHASVAHCDDAHSTAASGMTELKVGVVDVFVIRPHLPEWRVLVLQRGTATRCPSAWEAIHGKIEDGETPEDAAIREVREETGLEVARLYSITCNPFYVVPMRAVQVAVVFAAFIAEPAPPLTLGEEHARAEWLSVSDAMARFLWPRSREAMQHIVALLGTGDAGPAEDVLRVK